VEAVSEGDSLGSLTVVGLGIELGTQITLEAMHSIRRADKLFHMANPAAGRWLEGLNPSAESLAPYYREGVSRQLSYSRMVERVVSFARKGVDVCLATYGHPGMLSFPSHEALRRVRQEGMTGRLLPAVSAEDCLFADMGVDPGGPGWQSYEATHFLLRQPRFDPYSALVLWQITSIGDRTYRQHPKPREGLEILVDTLAAHYSGDHEVILYHASEFPVSGPHIERRRLSSIPDAELPRFAILCVPPLGPAPVDPEMVERLGLPEGEEPVGQSGEEIIG
jgi:hypothetical protein